MTIKDSLIESIMRDLTICQHLHTKLDPKMADWRPQENMRTTIHLLQYVCFIGKAMARHLVNPPADRSNAKEPIMALSKWSGEAVTFENFPEMIEAEKNEILDAFAPITDADLMRMTYHPDTGQDITLLQGLTDILIKYMCAYRHQLFIYAKLCGAEIGTSNNWMGVDPTQS